MAIYLIAFSTTRATDEGSIETRPFLQMVTFYGHDELDQAIEEARDYFSKSSDAADGWRISGETKLIELFDEDIERIKECASPKPRKKPVLSLVTKPT